MEMLSNLESLDAEKLLNLSTSVCDSDDEKDIMENDDLQQQVEKMCKKYQKAFSHFSALGMPAILDIEKQDFQELTTLGPDGQVRQIQIPAETPISESVETSPPFLKNFIVINLRNIRRSLKILPSDGQVEIQENLIAKILSEVTDKLKSEKPTKDQEAPETPPPTQKERGRGLKQVKNSKKRDRSDSKNSHQPKTSQKSHKTSSRKPSPKREYRNFHAPRSFSDDKPKPKPEPQREAVPPQQNFNPFHQNYQPWAVQAPPTPVPQYQPQFQGHTFWNNPVSTPAPPVPEIGTMTGYHQIPGIGPVFFPIYEGHEQGELREKRQRELNQATLQRHLGQM